MKRMIAALRVAAGTLTACSSTPSDQSTAQSEQVQQAEEGETVDLGGLIDDSVPLSGSPAVSTVLTPVASGSSVKKSGSATVDMSNKTDGYIMVKSGNTDKKLKVRVTGSSGTTYTYNLTGNDTMRPSRCLPAMASTRSRYSRTFRTQVQQGAFDLL